MAVLDGEGDHDYGTKRKPDMALRAEQPRLEHELQEMETWRMDGRDYLGQG
jgi:hypothetical protein